MKKKVSSGAEMQQLAALVASDVRGGETLLLYGDLGSGKTTFVQGLARALGVREQVTSPTFTIVGEYEAAGSDVTKLIHVDLYRLDNAREAAIEEVLEQASEAGRLTVIEWAEKLGQDTVGKRIYFEPGAHSRERIVTYNFA